MQRPSYYEALAEQHRHDLLREAAQIQLADQIDPSSAPPLLRRVYGPLLARLGHWMLIWGTRLTTNYAGPVVRPKV